MNGFDATASGKDHSTTPWVHGAWGTDELCTLSGECGESYAFRDVWTPIPPSSVGMRRSSGAYDRWDKAARHSLLASSRSIPRAQSRDPLSEEVIQQCEVVTSLSWS